MSETYIFGNTGADNTQIGTNTLTSLTTGVDNTAFGDTVFANLTTGDGNSGFGTSVGSAVGSNPSFSSGFGFEALLDLTTANSVSAFGRRALANMTVGNNNTAMGSNAGSNIITTADNTLLGYNANVVDSTTTNATAIGANSIASDNSAVIGSGAQSLATGAGIYNSIIGTGTVADVSSVDAIIVGNGAGQGTTIGSIILGYLAASTPGNIIDSSTIMGWRAAENTQSSFEDVIIGAEAARNVDFSQRNVLVGVGACKTPVPATTIGTPLEYVVAIGFEAGIQNSAAGNVFIGSGSGTNTTTETEIVAIGFEALKYVEASFNTAIGRRAMLGVDTVSVGAVNNVAVGDGALMAITTGIDNVVAGTRAGDTLTSGSNNVLMGYDADGSTTLMDSVVMGPLASATANDTVVVGYGASASVAGGISIGHSATVTATGDVQLGDPLGVPGVGTFSFRSQIVADESWVGGGATDVMIDNDGNICRGFVSTITGTSTGTTTLTLATYAMPDNSSRRIEALLTGRRTDAGGMNDIFSVRIDSAVKNDSVTIAINNVEEIQIKDDAAWVAAFVAVGLTVELQVTGVVGSTIDWAAEIREFSI